MNRIYRVIWNKTRNCYVAVSEIAKRNGKGGAVTDRRRCFSSVLAAMLLASLLNLGVAAPVWAEGSADITGAAGTAGSAETLAIIQAGSGIAVTQTGNVITVAAEEDETLAFLKKYLDYSSDYNDTEATGASVDARSDSSIALGKEAKITVLAEATKSVDNVAVGNRAQIFAGVANGSTGSNTAIGSGAVTGSDNIYTTQATAIGATARVYGSSGVSIGGGAQVGVNQKIGTVNNVSLYAYADQGIAIGQGATVYSDKSTAIGSAAKAGTRYSKTNYTNRNQAETNTTKQATAVGYNANASNENSTAIGANAKAYGKNSTAIGSDARASGENSTALGAITYATGIQNVAMGEGSQARKDETISIGFHTIAFNAEDIAIGHDTLTFGDSALAVGHLSLTGMPVREFTQNGNKYAELPRIGSQSSQISGNSRLCFQTSDGTVLLYESSVNSSGVETGTYYKVKAVPDSRFGWKFVKVDADGNETTDNNLAVKYIAKESTAKDIRTLGSPVKHIDYFYVDGQEAATKTEPLDGGIAIGSYTVAQGEHSMALGLTSAAYGKNSIAQGLYADAYGEGAIAFGHETVSGAHVTIKPNENIEDAHTTEFTVSAAGITDRVLVDGSVVGVDKNSIYNPYENEAGKPQVEIDSIGRILAVNGTAFGYDETKIRLASDSEVSVTRDAATGYYYYMKNGRKVMVASNEEMTFTGSGGQTVTIPAGKMALAAGGISFGSYSHAEGDRSMALGRAAGAYDRNSSAVGLFANAYGEGAMAIGHNASAGAVVDIEELENGYHTAYLKLDSNGNGIRTYTEGGDPTQGGIAIGSYAHASGDRSIALGRAAGAYDTNTTAFGIYANALGDGAMAVGHGASTGVKVTVNKGGADDFWTTAPQVDGTTGNPVSNGSAGGIAIGSYAHTEGTRALSVGRVAGAYGENSTSIGLRSNAYGEGSIAFGHGVVAGSEADKYAAQVVELHNNPALVYDLDGKDGNIYHDKNGNETTISPGNVIGAVAIGSYAEATGRGSLSVGRYSQAKSAYSTTLGIRASVLESAENAIAIGREATVDTLSSGRTYGGLGSIAIGTLANVKGQNSIAIGMADMLNEAGTEIVGPDDRKPTSVTGDASLAIGRNDTVTGNSSIAIGDKSAVTGNKNIAIGTENIVKGNSSGAIGDPNKVNGDNSYILGNNSSIGTVNSDTGSGDTEIAVDNAFIIGNESSTVNKGSLIFGSGSSVTADNGLALGNNTSVSVADGVALGSESLADRGPAEQAGYDVMTGTSYAGTGSGSAVWAATRSAVSIGDPANDITRQIIGVAAGLDDTDAVNVAQLKRARVEVRAGDNITVLTTYDETDGHAIYTLSSSPESVVAAGTNVTSVDITSSADGAGSGTGGTETGGGAASETGTTDHGTYTTNTYTVNVKDTTLEPSDAGLTLTDEALGLSVADTDGKKVTGNVSLSDLQEKIDTNTTYTLSGNGEADGKGNTTYTVTLTGSDGKEPTTATIADTNTTYTIAAEKGTGSTVNTYTITDSEGTGIGTIKDTDTDTQYELSGSKGEKAADGSTTYTISLKDKEGNEAGSAEVVDTDTNTQYVLSGEKAETENGAKYTISLKDLEGNDAGKAEIVDTRNTVEAGDDTIEVKSTENADGSLTYTIKSNVKAVSNVEVKAGSDNVTVDSEDVGDKKIYTVDVKTDGIVASGDTGIVTGDTVYNETRVQNDGNYIKKDNTAAENITALDEKVHENAQNIESINNQVRNTSNQVNRLDDRMRKGLAGAAALAALHPMDFNPDDKLQFSAGVGNYRGETAAALGAFYRPDESVMFSIGGTFGNGDNMVNAGITFGLDGTRNRITRSRTAMAHEIVELKDHIARQDEQIAKLTELVNKLVGPEQRLENTSMFPDVPENHWAYAYLEDLQKRGIIEGYPDGQFQGDRSMTRYEYAAVLDRALRKGVELDARVAKEFEPELGRIYVERVKGQDNDRNKIERVRVNNSDSKYPEGKTRDVYGSKIVTEVPEKVAEAK